MIYELIYHWVDGQNTGHGLNRKSIWRNQMQTQWGNNPEYTISTWYDFSCWALPAGISWRHFSDVKENKCFSFTFRFLCFGIELEIWKWRK